MAADARKTDAPPAVDRAEDGSPLFAARGLLPVELDGSRVQWHLCGRWFRQLAPTHVTRIHGVTAAEYRVLAGLRPRHPLHAPEVRARHAAVMRRLIDTDERVQQGMQLGLELARSDELQRAAEDVRRERPVALERDRQLAAYGGAGWARPRRRVPSAPREARARARPHKPRRVLPDAVRARVRAGRRTGP